MNITNHAIIKKLASNDLWTQLNQIQEECAELIVAINKLRRNKKDAYESVVKEIADVTIMMEQAKYIFDAIDINNSIDEKLSRCNLRLKDGKL